MPTLVHLVALVGLGMLLELGGPVETLLANIALVGEVLGVHRDDVAFEVRGVGALVLAVWTLVGLVALYHLHVSLQLQLVGIGLRAMAALVGEVCPMLALNVSL